MISFIPSLSILNLDNVFRIISQFYALELEQLPILDEYQALMKLVAENQRGLCSHLPKLLQLRTVEKVMNGSFISAIRTVLKLPQQLPTHPPTLNCVVIFEQPSEHRQFLYLIKIVSTLNLMHSLFYKLDLTLILSCESRK